MAESPALETEFQGTCLAHCGFYGSDALQGFCSLCNRQRHFLESRLPACVRLPSDAVGEAISQWRAARELAKARIEQEVALDLQRLAMTDEDVLQLVGPEQCTLGSLMEVLISRVAMAKHAPDGAVPRFMMTATQALRLVGTLEGAFVPRTYNNYEAEPEWPGILTLHPFILDQFDEWVRDPISSKILPFGDPLGVLTHEVPENLRFCVHLPSTSSEVSSELALCVEDSVVVRTLDPCNLRSILLQRRLQLQRLLALAMGGHSRLGSASPVRLLTPWIIRDCIGPFLLNDGCYDAVDTQPVSQWARARSRYCHTSWLQQWTALWVRAVTCG